MLEHAQIAPEAFAGNQPRDVRKNKVRLELQQCLCILPELAAAVGLLLGGNFPTRHAVVGDLRIDLRELGAEEADFLERVISDGENGVAMPGSFHQGMLVKA